MRTHCFRPRSARAKEERVGEKKQEGMRLPAPSIVLYFFLTEIDSSFFFYIFLRTHLERRPPGFVCCRLFGYTGLDEARWFSHVNNLSSLRQQPNSDCACTNVNLHRHRYGTACPHRWRYV